MIPETEPRGGRVLLGSSNLSFDFGTLEMSANKASWRCASVATRSFASCRRTKGPNRAALPCFQERRVNYSSLPRRVQTHFCYQSFMKLLIPVFCAGRLLTSGNDDPGGQL